MTIMTIDVKEEQDGSFTISWDENDPLESILNTWTEQDFIDCIIQECERTLSKLSTEDAPGLTDAS